MTNQLNFEAEPLRGYGGFQNENFEEETRTRDQRSGGGRPFVSPPRGPRGSFFSPPRPQPGRVFPPIGMRSVRFGNPGVSPRFRVGGIPMLPVSPRFGVRLAGLGPRAIFAPGTSSILRPGRFFQGAFRGPRMLFGGPRSQFGAGPFGPGGFGSGRFGPGPFGPGGGPFGPGRRRFFRRFPFLAGGGFGSSGSDPQVITWAQGCLARIVGEWVPQDGAMGPTTRRAIRIFQSQNQLPATSTLDDSTIVALQQACTAGAEGAAPAPGPDAGAPDAPAPGGGEQPGQTEAEFYEYEMEAPDQSKLLAFRLPEAPYSDTLMHRIHKGIEIFEAVHITTAVFGVELAGMIGLGFTALAPLVTLVGTFFALGAGYAEARAEIARRRLKMGFAYGVVLGADKRKWSYVKERFYEAKPEPNSFDQQAGKIAQQSFNLGLAAGYLQGREIAKSSGKMDFFWKSITAALSPTDRKWYSGDTKTWGRLMWRDWYITAATKFLGIYVKD